MAGDNAVVTRVADPTNPNKWKVDPVTGGVFRAADAARHREDRRRRSTSSPVATSWSATTRTTGCSARAAPTWSRATPTTTSSRATRTVTGSRATTTRTTSIGGSSFPDQPDTGDVLWGGQGADVLAGDNTCLVRKATGVPFDPTSCEKLDTPAPTEFHYVTSQLGVDDTARRGAARHRRARRDRVRRRPAQRRRGRRRGVRPGRHRLPLR